MHVLTDKKEIAEAQTKLVERIKKAATKSGTAQLGHQGGGAATETFYLADVDLWFGGRIVENRYWNAFGRGDPFGARSTNIIVEINPPLSGTDARIAGLFLEDDDGNLYLAHRGQIGGGRAGISKNAFLEFYEGRRETVLSNGGSTEVLLVGAIDSPTFLNDIRAFVEAVDQFKRQAVDEDERSAGSKAPASDDDRTRAWDEFVHWAKTVKGWFDFDAQERDYKLKIADNLMNAKDALANGNAEWPTLLKKAFGPPNNLTHYIWTARFLEWVKQHTAEAAKALQTFWLGRGSPADRLEAFVQAVPDEILKTPGNRVNLGSFLLGAVDVREYPVYRPTPFTKGRELTGHAPPRAGASPREVYENALAFLDEIRAQCAKRGLELRDRLDAQSVLWVITTALGRDGFSADEKGALSRYLGGEKAPPAPHQQAWLFQANPKVWNLAEHLEEMKPGALGEWSVSRFGDQMKDGDPVLLWHGGPDAGIRALGTLVGSVHERAMPEWQTERGKEGKAEQCISYRLDRILEDPLDKEELVADPVLSSLSVIRAPQGTNFRVTTEQWARLQQLLDVAAPQKRATTFEEIRAAIDQCGLKISERMLRRFHLAVQTRGFVVLCGVSGTGKTWLAEAYADAIGAASCLVPVAPNWTANEDLLGYFNPLDGTYHDTQFSRFLRESSTEYATATAARRDPQTYVLILDEMNLARVEYYFAKFLSAMERRARGVAEIELGPDDTVKLTPNLLFVGTVNVDETTHLLSDKVFDRAQVLELEIDRADLERFMGEVPYRDALLEIWDAVAAVAPFAFRVVEDIRNYIDDAEGLKISWPEALDEQIVQKVLPKLSGAEVGPAIEKIVSLSQDRYPLTYAKATTMRRDFEQHGFASYF